MSEAKVVNRQLRAINNDGRIMQAAVGILDRQGWDYFTFAHISREAGLSSRPIRLRYSTLSELVEDVYSKSLEEPFLERINLLHTTVYSTGPKREEKLTQIVLDFFADTPEKRALTELFIVSAYEPEISAAFTKKLHPLLTPKFDANQRDGKTTEFGLLLMLSFGLMIETHQGQLSADELRDVVHSFVSHIQKVESETSLPEVQAPHLDSIANVDSGDLVLDELLVATLEELANFGLSKSTVVRIASRCNRTEGFIFSRYATKNDLLIDAVRFSFKSAIHLNVEFQTKLFEKFTASETLALTMREFMLPKHAIQRSLALEEIRLSWRNPELHSVYRGEQERAFHGLDNAEAKAKLFLNVSFNSGILMLAFIEPASWNLPFITRAKGLVDFFQ